MQIKDRTFIITGGASGLATTANDLGISLGVAVIGSVGIAACRSQVGDLLQVLGAAGVGQQTTVHGGMQGLDPAVEALGEAGEVLDLGHRQAEPGDRRGGAAGRDQLDPGVGEPAHEVLEAGLVVDGDEGTADGTTV